MKISICNKIYEINCIKEEEQKISALAKRFDLKARQLGQSLGLDNEIIILLCALNLEAKIDELEEKHQQELMDFSTENIVQITDRIKEIHSKIKP